MSLKVGDVVRVRVSGQRRLVRGVIMDLPEGEQVLVVTGLNSLIADLKNVIMIRKPHEKATVLAKVNSVRQAARDLTRNRGNKKVAKG